MKAVSHRQLAIWLEELYMQNVKKQYRRAFRLGSVEPDYNKFTYFHGWWTHEKLHGHHYANCQNVIKKLMKKLTESRRQNLFYFYRLGKLTHYLADCFTYPHNKHFTENLWQHIQYEEVFHDRMLQYLTKKAREGKRRIHGRWDREVFLWLHEAYMASAPSCELDCQYICMVTELATGWFLQPAPVCEPVFGLDETQEMRRLA